MAPDGLSVPVLACYYPSGRSVTCPIWQIQSYIFPFWETGGGWNVYYFTVGLVRLAVVFALVIVIFLWGKQFNYPEKTLTYLGGKHVEIS